MGRRAGAGRARTGAEPPCSDQASGRVGFAMPGSGLAAQGAAEGSEVLGAARVGVGGPEGGRSRADLPGCAAAFLMLLLREET